jgi:type IV secretory pathway TrbL component
LALTDLMNRTGPSRLAGSIFASQEPSFLVTVTLSPVISVTVLGASAGAGVGCRAAAGETATPVATTAKTAAWMKPRLRTDRPL